MIDQLLTGFDAPELNTLYIDRTFKGSNLIQAYSRTNRLHNFEKKPWGNVVNYRWPTQNELEMNKAFAIYSNRDSANIQMSLDEMIDLNTKEGILAVDYNQTIDELQGLILDIRESTEGFVMVPRSEHSQEALYDSLKEYNKLINKVKQYPYDDKTETGYPKDDINKFYESIGLSEEEELRLTTNISNELKDRIAKSENIDLSMIDLDMEHVLDVIINYDYLVELIAQMANEVNNNEMSVATRTRELIKNELNKLENDMERTRMQRFIDKIFDGEVTFDKYPVSNDYEAINNALEISETEADYNIISKFIYEWGIGNIITPKKLYDMTKRHKKGENDLDNQGAVSSLLIEAKDDYKLYAIKEYANLSWIRYRNQFRDAIHNLAEKMKEYE